MYFRVIDGQMVPGDVVRLMNTGKEYQVDEVGVLAPKQVPVRHTPLAFHLTCMRWNSTKMLSTQITHKVTNRIADIKTKRAPEMRG